MLGLYKALSTVSYLVGRPIMGTLAAFEEGEGLWAGRLGRLPGEVLDAAPFDIWLQAVSVGEVSVAESIVGSLDRQRPGLKIALSSTTPAGIARALSSLGERCHVFPYPFDFPQVVSQVLRQIRPRVYACIETELWPNLLMKARGAGCKTVLLNGRISGKSFPRYQRLASVIRPVLSGFDKVCAISGIHAQRLKSLGVRQEDLVISGNAKYEGLLKRVDTERAGFIRKKFGIKEGTRVFVAGSIRGGEERDLVLTIKGLSRDFPHLLSFLVPRHLKRVSRIEHILKRVPLPFQYWSALEMGEQLDTSIVVVDVIGPLFDLYGIADAAFVGGSLVPKGGQNLLEPAAWRCPVFYGEHTDNFEEARLALKQHDADGQVRDWRELTREVAKMLADLSLQRKRGDNAYSALDELARNAATIQARLLCTFFP